MAAHYSSNHCKLRIRIRRFQTNPNLLISSAEEANTIVGDDILFPKTITEVESCSETCTGGALWIAIGHF